MARKMSELAPARKPTTRKTKPWHHHRSAGLVAIICTMLQYALRYECGYQDKEVVYNQATIGEDARGTIASMKASREKREPVVCFLRETVGLALFELGAF